MITSTVSELKCATQALDELCFKTECLNGMEVLKGEGTKTMVFWGGKLADRENRWKPRHVPRVMPLRERESGERKKAERERWKK